MIEKILLAQWATLSPSLLMQTFPTVQAINLRQRLKWLDTIPALMQTGREQSTLGALYFQTYDCDRAVQHYLQAMQAFHTAQDVTALGNTLSQLSVVFAHRQQYRWAIDYAKHAVKYLSETDDLSSYAAALHNLGVAYYHRGRYQPALTTLQKAIARRRCLDDQIGEALTLGCLGRVQAAIGQFSKALSSYQAALSIYHQHQVQFEGCWYEIAMRQRLGDIASKLGHTDLAIAHYQTALCLSRDTDSLVRAKVLDELGQCYKKLEQHTLALECYHQAQQVIYDWRQRSDRPPRGFTTSSNPFSLYY